MLETLITLFLAYKYIVLYPIAVIEGPIIAVVAGSLAASGHINFLAAYAIIIIGDLSGDTLYYLLGRYGRKGLLKRWGHYVGLTPERLQKADNHYLKHAAKTLIIGKLAFSFEIPVIVSAGLVRFPYLEFIAYMAIGAMPKTLGLMLLGSFFGFSLGGAQHDLAYAARISLVVIVAIAALILIHQLGKRQAQWNTGTRKSAPGRDTTARR